MTIGFRVLGRERRVDDGLARRFAALPVANVSDSMSRLTAAGARLRPFHGPGTRMAGPALTVRTRPGDNLMVHKAIEMAEAGDVIVVDAGGDLTNAILGEIMVTMSLRKGIAGFVIDGAIRDADEIRASGIAMFAAGVTHRGPYKDGPGEINAPVAIGGMIVHPGDLILGDGDGVVVVPYEEAEAILAATERKQEAERRELTEIAEGTNDRTWIDRVLRERGCELPS